MKNTVDYEKHKKALDSFEEAKRQHDENPLEAIRKIREARQYFLELGNRDMCLTTLSFEFKWLYDIDIKNFYDKYESRILEFLDNFCDYSSDRRYVNIEFNYLKHKSINFHHNGEHVNQRDALKELVELTTSNRTSFPFISENQIQIWRSQIMSIEARLSIARQDDLSTQARYYLEAASLSVPINYEDQLAKRMQIIRYSHLSTYHKLVAFSFLHTRGLTIDFDEVVKSLISSVEYAKEAYELSKDQFRKIHYIYMSYWLNIFNARRLTINKVRPRELTHNNKFDMAIDCLNKAIKNAKYLEENSCYIFPNYYADFDDLRHDRLVIRAFELLSLGDLKKSLSKLQKWLERSEKKRGTWKYNSVKLRFIAMNLLANLSLILNNDVSTMKSAEISANEVRNQLNTLTSEVRLGKASERIMEILVFLALDYERNQLTHESFNTVIEEFQKVFPTDSVVEDYGAISSIKLLEKPDEFDLLPEFIKTEFNRIHSLNESNRIILALDKILGAYLAIIAEYYYLKYLKYQEADWVNHLPSHFDKSFESMSVSKLADCIFELIQSIGKREQGLDTLKEYVEIRKEKNENVQISELVQLGKKVIKNTYLSFFPHIIHVLREPSDNNNSSELSEEYFVCKRIWGRNWPNKLLCSDDWPLAKGKYYYLRPQWKNFNFEKADKYRKEFEVYETNFYKKIERSISTQDDEVSRSHLIWKVHTFPEKLRNFERMIEQNVAERTIGQFLKDNPWIFGLAYKTLYAESAIDLEHRPDYILQTYTNDYVVVEIKKAGVKLFETKNEKLKNSPWASPQLYHTKELSNAIRQLTNYQRAFRKRAWQESQGSHEHEVRGILIIGTIQGERERKELKLLNNEQNRNIREITTYDELLKNAKGLVQQLLMK